MSDTRIGTEVIGHNNEKYKIVDHIGSGSLGEVYKAQGTQSGKIVAVKLMIETPHPSSKSMQSERSLLNEIDVLQTQLQTQNVHPNIVQILYVDRGSDLEVGPYIIMEFVEGETLQALLERRQQESKLFTIQESLDLMRGIARGAQAINANIIHRDMKPDNVLLDHSVKPIRPRITDLGIAKIGGQSTRPGTFKQTQSLWYRAPEAWHGEQHTYKMDVYSTGLLFYQILTLNHPFIVSGSYIDDVEWRNIHLYRLLPDIRKIRNDVPVPIIDLIVKMTQKSPGDRPDWNYVLAVLEPVAELPQVSPILSPSLVAALEQRNEEIRQENDQQMAARLLERQNSECLQSRSKEYQRSAIRLLENFDLIINELNKVGNASQIQIKKDSDVSRSYILPKGRLVICKAFGYRGGASATSSNGILGGGYVGVEGGLSANFLLTGNADNISYAQWSTVEFNVNAIYHGNTRLRLYREAKLSDREIRFLEFEDGNQPWRRNFTSYFGFKDEELFYRHWGFNRSVHTYSCQQRNGSSQVFEDILKLGFSMP